MNAFLKKSFCALLLLVVVLTGCEPVNNTESTEGSTPPQNEIQLLPGQTTPLQFSYLRMNFSDVVAGEKIIAEYPFKNMSERTIRITDVLKSCECLSTEFPTRNLAPGEIDKIKVTFDTEGQAKDVPSTHYKNFAVMIEGQETPMESLYLEGRVLPNPNAE